MLEVKSWCIEQGARVWSLVPVLLGASLSTGCTSSFILYYVLIISFFHSCMYLLISLFIHFIFISRPLLKTTTCKEMICDDDINEKNPKILSWNKCTSLWINEPSIKAHMTFWSQLVSASSKWVHWINVYNKNKQIRCTACALKRGWRSKRTLGLWKKTCSWSG